MNIPLLNVVIDIETILKYKVPSVQTDIRSKADNVIDSAINSKHTSQIAKQQINIIKKLKEKDVVYVKADKSNQIVILNKSD